MKERTKTGLILVLIVGIISMTVAYANFSSRLLIKSSTKVNASNWSVHFANLKQVENSSDNTAKVKSPAVISDSSTIISGLSMTLNKPGDSVTYTFDIVNDGDINAKISSYVLGTPVCESMPSFCNNIEYTLKYTDGTEIRVGDTLNVGESRNVTMKISLSNDVSQMPTSSLIISNLNAYFDYVQN